MKNTSLNRILLYTLMAITVIAVYITVNSYYTQVSIYEEKELFKLDCIANAVAYKISGDTHDSLVAAYPGVNYTEEVKKDARYQKLYNQIAMAKKMTMLPSEMFTIISEANPGGKKYYRAVSTDDPVWLAELSGISARLDTLYSKGGMIGRFETAEGTRLGAISPVKNGKGEIVGMLQVDETFESFLQKARNQIYINILVSLFFILIIGTLMFFSVRSILNRQKRLAFEKAELESLRQELVANVSHDLRTPLASIHGYIETVLMKGENLDSDTRNKYLNTTLQSTDKLRSLVDELFELSKLESKERKLNAEPFSVSELVLDTASHFKGQAAEKSIAIQTSIPQNIPQVIGDIALIDRVMNNLLSNAIRHSNPGGSIDVSVELLGNEVKIKVADQGEGISKEDLPHVFNRFHKGKSSRSGSGLGLAIVKNILEMHKSNFSVESEVGNGTSFSFTLPLS